MVDISIDAHVFWERLKQLHRSWLVRCHCAVAALCPFPLTCGILGFAQDHRGEPDAIWRGADALVVDSGTASEEDLYSKSASLQTWLFGYEFPETVIVICSRLVIILSSKKKGKTPRPRPPLPAAAVLTPVHQSL